MLLQNSQPVLHQLIVIGLVARGALELGNARSLGKGDPDLGNEHALKIQAYNVHITHGRFSLGRELLLIDNDITVGAVNDVLLGGRLPLFARGDCCPLSLGAGKMDVDQIGTACKRLRIDRG